MQLATLLGFHTLLTPVGCPTPAVDVSLWGWGCLGTDVLIPHLVCYATWFSPLCRALPQGLQLTQPSQLQASLCFFPVTGCLSFSFPGGVVWASGLPLFFWASPALLACWGGWGYAPCVRVLQLWWCLLGLLVRSPCCPSLTFGCVCFWLAVS